MLTFHGENHVLKAIFDGTDEAERHFANIRMASIDLCATQDDIENMDSKDELGINGLVKAELGDHHQENKLSTRLEASHTIERILANAGVSYSHQNSEILGSSKVETVISKMAGIAAMDAKTRNRQAYLPDSEDSKSMKRLKHDLRQSLVKPSMSSSKKVADAVSTGARPSTTSRRTLPWQK